MSKRSVIIMLAILFAGLVAVTGYAYVQKPELNKTFILQLIK